MKGGLRLERTFTADSAHKEGEVVPFLIKSLNKLGLSKLIDKMPFTIEGARMVKKIMSKFFMHLHPQHVCSLLATHYGLKPSSIIESIELKLWEEFLEAIKALKLLAAYRTEEGFVIVENDSLSYFDQKSWELFLLDGLVSNIKKLNFNKWKAVMPLSDNDIDVHDVYVSRDLNTLLDLIRLHNAKELASKKIKIEQRLGKILGYPECCIINYTTKGAVKAWHDFHKELIDAGIDQNMPVEFWSIYHVPCSPKCKYSLELGRKYLEVVKDFSKELYVKVVQDLTSSHLAFSVGRRFIDFKETNFPVSSKVLGEVEKRLPTPKIVVTGNVLRPFSYFRWSKGKYRLIVTPEIMGRKVIACSPGYGVLVIDEELKTFIYVTRDLLSRESLRYSSTAFRIYRSIK